MVYTYRRAMNAQAVQSSVQLRDGLQRKGGGDPALDRGHHPEPCDPRDAARLQSSTRPSATRCAGRTSSPRRWIWPMPGPRFPTASRLPSTSPTSRSGNTGDSPRGDPAKIFKAIGRRNRLCLGRASTAAWAAGFRRRSALQLHRHHHADPLYPIISTRKLHGTLAQSGVGLPVADYPLFNLLTYPQINFGYAKPGEPFVAKRNWWAFSMDVAGA